MYYTGKECEVSPYTEAYKAIKNVLILQAATAYDNRDTGETRESLHSRGGFVMFFRNGTESL
jgi:hypothetical protein